MLREYVWSAKAVVNAIEPSTPIDEYLVSSLVYITLKRKNPKPRLFNPHTLIYFYDTPQGVWSPEISELLKESFFDVNIKKSHEIINEMLKIIKESNLTSKDDIIKEARRLYNKYD